MIYNSSKESSKYIEISVNSSSSIKDSINSITNKKFLSQNQNDNEIEEKINSDEDILTYEEKTIREVNLLSFGFNSFESHVNIRDIQNLNVIQDENFNKEVVKEDNDFRSRNKTVSFNLNNKKMENRVKDNNLQFDFNFNKNNIKDKLILTKFKEKITTEGIIEEKINEESYLNGIVNLNNKSDNNFYIYEKREINEDEDKSEIDTERDICGINIVKFNSEKNEFNEFITQSDVEISKNDDFIKIDNYNNNYIIVYSHNSKPLQIMKIISEDSDMIRLLPIIDNKESNGFISLKEDIFYQTLSIKSLSPVLNFLDLDHPNELSYLKNIETLIRTKNTFAYIGSIIYIAISDEILNIYEFNEWMNIFLNKKTNKDILHSNCPSQNDNLNKNYIFFVKNMNFLLKYPYKNRNKFQFDVLYNIIYYYICNNSMKSLHQDSSNHHMSFIYKKIFSLLNIMNIDLILNFSSKNIKNKENKKSSVFSLNFIPLLTIESIKSMKTMILLSNEKYFNNNLYEVIKEMYVNYLQISHNHYEDIENLYLNDSHLYKNSHFNNRVLIFNDMIKDYSGFIFLLYEILHEIKREYELNEIIDYMVLIYFIKNHKKREFFKENPIRFHCIYYIYSNILIIYLYNKVFEIINHQLNEDCFYNKNYHEKNNTINMNFLLNIGNNSDTLLLNEVIYDEVLFSFNQEYEKEKKIKENNCKNVNSNKESLIYSYLIYNLNLLEKFLNNKEYKYDINNIIKLEKEYLVSSNIKIDNDEYMNKIQNISDIYNKSSNITKSYILNNSFLLLNRIINENYSERKTIKQVWNIYYDNFDNYFYEYKGEKPNEAISHSALLPLKSMSFNKIIDYIKYFRKKKEDVENINNHAYEEDKRIDPDYILFSYKEFHHKYLFIYKNIYNNSLNKNNIKIILDTIILEINKSYMKNKYIINKYSYILNDSYIKIEFNLYIFLNSLVKLVLEKPVIIIQSNIKSYFNRKKIKTLRKSINIIQKSYRKYYLNKLKHNISNITEGIEYLQKTYLSREPYLMCLFYKFYININKKSGEYQKLLLKREEFDIKNTELKNKYHQQNHLIKNISQSSQNIFKLNTINSLNTIKTQMSFKKSKITQNINVSSTKNKKLISNKSLQKKFSSEKSIIECNNRKLNKRTSTKKMILLNEIEYEKTNILNFENKISVISKRIVENEIEIQKQRELIEKFLVIIEMNKLKDEFNIDFEYN